MRHETAVRQLRKIAGRCSEVARLWHEEPVLLSAHAFGPVLDGLDDVPVVKVAFVLNLPVDELTWCAEPPGCSGLPHLLEVDKAPVEWYWRPALWPVWNHRIRRPLRIWSLGGPDGAALDALAQGAVDDLRMPAPPAEDERKQFAAELAASTVHLREVKERYWEQGWRSEHRGYGVYPEHHLWNAVHGYLDFLNTATTLDFPPGESGQVSEESPRLS